MFAFCAAFLRLGLAFFCGSLECFSFSFVLPSYLFEDFMYFANIFLRQFVLFNLVSYRGFGSCPLCFY